MRVLNAGSHPVFDMSSSQVVISGRPMLTRIEQLAEFSVARGCGFAMIAIGSTMAGLSFEPLQSLRTGAALCLLTTLTLLLKAVHAQTKPYKSTELWLLLKPDDRPPDAVAQYVLARALRQAYLRFAYYFAAGTAALTAFTILMSFLRPAAS